MKSISHLLYPLDRIFSVSSHLPIFRALQNTREGMSGRGIAHQAHINHQSCAVALKNLESLGVLERQGSGKVQLIRLNFENHIVNHLLLPLLRQEREWMNEMKQEIIKTFKKDVLAATFFGSVARGQDTLGSDIDLLLLVKGSHQNKVSAHASAYGEKFKRQHGIRLSPIVMTIVQVKEKIKKGNPLMKNILNDGIDLLPQKLRDVVL